MKKHELNCPNCNASLEPRDGLDTFYCPYCGTKIVLEGMSDSAYKARMFERAIDFGETALKMHQEDKIRKEQQKAKERKTGFIVGISALAILLAITFIMPIVGNSSSDEDPHQGVSGATSAATNSSSGQNNTSSSSSSGGQGLTPSTNDTLVILESGYQTTEDGYIHYAVCLENKSTNMAAEFPVINVIGKDVNGAIVFTDNWTLGVILPGEKTYYASLAGNGNAVADKVEFTVSMDRNNWKEADRYPEGIYSIEGANYIKGSYGATSFTGQITLTKDNDDFVNPMIVVVLRDESGNIVAGYETYLSSELVVGNSVAFELSAYQVPDFDAFEVYVNPWL